MKKKSIPIAPAPECPACTTPSRCGSSHLKMKKGPNCAGKANGPDECDCLNWCGDDPWLKDGKSAPCAHLLTQRADKAAAVERADRLKKFLDAAAGEGLVLDGIDAADLYVSIYGSKEGAPT
ncbi:MAG: hypothetical protein IV107_11050 [Paucibacter sp.]|nr:hypothetical protein [Roseateles sp.]